MDVVISLDLMSLKAFSSKSNLHSISEYGLKLTDTEQCFKRLVPVLNEHDTYYPQFSCVFVCRILFYVSRLIQNVILSLFFKYLVSCRTSELLCFPVFFLEAEKIFK